MVAMEARSILMTLQALAKKYELSPVVISRWKREFIGNSKAAFESKGETEEESRKREKALYEKIGILEMKLDFAKRASEKLGIPMPADD